MLENVVRYRLIETKVIEYEETDYSMLPLVFFDGNSVLIKTPKNGNVRQVTRPYIYHAKGAQRLKNYAGISLANEIENVVQHKFMVAKEALPKEEEYLQAYKDVQKANVVVFNSVYEENPDQPINNPIREIAKVPAPPEIVQAFTGADQLMQNILGSYDASAGINNNQSSGKALEISALQSNATSMPYIVGYMQGLQRIAQIYVDLLPKYRITPSTLPITDEDGKKSYIKINQKDGMDMDFDPYALNIVVKAGASFQVQKSRTLMMVKELMGMSPLMQQFMAEKGLPFILDNMEGRGVEQLKDMVEEWTKGLEQQKQMAMQQQQQEMQNNPAMLKLQQNQQKMMLDSKKAESQFTIDMAKLQQDEAKIIADLQQSKEANLVQIVKANTERFSKEMDVQLKKLDMQHRHSKEVVELHHKVNQPAKESKEG
jgi:hypothetical protein